MKKLLSALLCFTILMGYVVMLAVPALADLEEDVAPTTEVCEHIFDAWSDAGQSHTQSCTICGAVNTQDHAWGNGTVLVQPTCNTPGEQSVSCSVCGASKTEALSPTGIHTLTDLQQASDSEHTGVCSVCGQTVTQSHSWGIGVITVPATCIQEGEISYTCSACQYTKKDVVAMLTSHNWAPWQRVDDTIHKSYCTYCMQEEIGDHNYSTIWSTDSESHYHVCSACSDQKDVQSHIAGPEATKTTPQLCLICNYVIAPTLDHVHEYAEEWTTDEKGHWYTCASCAVKGEYAQHKFENDCDPDCEVCGYERAAEHNYGEEWVSDEENHYHECSVCGDVQDKELHAAAEESDDCTVCGYDLASSEEDPQTTQNKTVKKKGPFPWWGALIIAAVAAALIPVISFFQGDY